MQFKPVNEHEAAMLMSTGRSGNAKIMEMLDLFMTSDQKIVEVDWAGSYVHAGSCAASFQNGIKRCHVGAKTIRRGDRVFLLKTTV